MAAKKLIREPGPSAGAPFTIGVEGTAQRARFVDRPNQFVVRCRLEEDGRLIRAFLPNPGRMWELLLPGVPLWVEQQPSRIAGPRARDPRTRDPRTRDRRRTRRTDHTVLATERDAFPIVLHTQRANALVRHLIEAGAIPPLEGSQVVDSEVTVGGSRFDFLLRRGQRDLFLEVKSTTLFGNGVAMFPDAVTQRGCKHLSELAALQRDGGVDAAVLFVVHAPSARWFMPDYHTDLAFSQALIGAHDAGVRILPAAIEWTRDLALATPVEMLEIPWPHVRREAHDRGAYLLILRLRRDRRLEIGRLGSKLFPRGYYLYVGSAMANLSARMARHRRLRKRLHWHVDYLRAAACEAITLPVRSSTRDECDLAQALGSVATSTCDGFGSSDCGCPSHLFTMPGNPLHEARFHGVLQRFRMRHPRP